MYYYYTISMIPSKLFYPLYLRYFSISVILSIPCYYLSELVKILYKVNIPVSIIFASLLITCMVGCYKWILGETLLEEYKKIIVKTRFNNISWKFAFYSFIILETVSTITMTVLESVHVTSGWIAIIISIIIDYFVINFWLEKYAKLEISVKGNTDQNNDIQS